MKTSGLNHQKVFIIYLICVIQVYGSTLTISQYPQYPTVSTTAILTCHIPSFTSLAEWRKNGVRQTQCDSIECTPPSRTGYQFSKDTTIMNVTILSADIALDETTWTCLHNADAGSHNLIVYKLPSNLSIVGDNSTTLYDDETVALSVSTGCVNPGDSAHYNVTWKYVEANNNAENNFGQIITQNVNSFGVCQNPNEKNLTLNLVITNKMNTGSTTLYISQVKITFTMAENDFKAMKIVSYNVTTIGTKRPTDPPNKEENNTGKIVGGTVGGFFGVCLLLLAGRVIYVFYKIKKEGKPALGVKALIKKILICDFCSRICDKQKTNSVGGDHAIVSKQGKPHGGNGSKSRKPGDGNGQEKSTESEPKNSMSDVSRNDVQIQMEEGHVKLYVESPQVNPSRLGHQDEANHKSVQSKPFDQKESRPLPPQPGNNNQNKRGISANFDDKQGLAHDTPRAINLAPIDPQLLSNKQNEGTSENSRKKKKKKKNKNKKTDEIKSTDDLGE